MSKKKRNNKTTDVITRMTSGKVWYRTAKIKEGPDENRMMNVSFSSEEPYLREDFDGKYYEILDHSPESVRMDRFKAVGPLLFQHDPNQLLGSIREANLQDKRLNTRVEFSGTPAADEKFQMAKEGHLRTSSVGYVTHKAVEDGEIDGVRCYRAVDWEPYEGSLVTIPADHTVGVGRAADLDPDKDPDDQLEEFEEDEADKCNTEKNEEEKDMDEKEKQALEAESKKNADEVIVLRNERKLDEGRKKEIIETAKKYGCLDLAMDFLSDDKKSVQEFNNAVLERINKKNQEAVTLGLGENEVKRYSLTRALRAIESKNWKGAE
jgi:HK97 family phage prohead protease